MTETAKPRRYHDLDALRAFAMLLGIVLHACMSFLPLPITVSANQDIYQDSPGYGWLLSAIHGFRMPLFFVVSGMFTALLWQKRGIGGLLRHRAFRIGVPLLIGLFTIVPVVFVFSIGFGRNIWSASAKGDEAYVRAFTAVRADLNKPMQAEGIPGNGSTPLHIAAASGQPAVAQILIDAGAQVDSRATDLVDGKPSHATPLHYAAFSFQPGIAGLLIESGADVNARDSNGGTPLDYALLSSDDAMAKQLIASGAKHGEELGEPGTVNSDALAKSDSAAVSAGDAEIDYLGNWIKGASIQIQLMAMLVFFPAFAHLWFLYYLLWLVFGFAALIWIARLIGFTSMPSLFSRFSTIVLVAVPLTFMCQLLMVQGFGPDTASGILPWPPTLAYYGVFFITGSILFMQNWHASLGKNFVFYLVAAAVLLPFGLAALEMRSSSFWMYQSIASLLSVLYAWCMILAMFGLFRRFGSAENSKVRYISDASYWIYLIHLPMVYWLQAELSDWMIPSLLKLSIISAVTFLLAIVSYHWLVRYTVIGAVLHGRKVRNGHVISTPSEPRLTAETNAC